MVYPGGPNPVPAGMQAAIQVMAAGSAAGPSSARQAAPTLDLDLAKYDSDSDFDYRPRPPPRY